jgi:hypothetical protein
MKFVSTCAALVLTSLSLLASPAIASSTPGAGQIQDIAATDNGALLFTVDASSFDVITKEKKVKWQRSAPPSCGSGQSARWAIDGSSASGQALMQTLLWAASQRKFVQVTGTGKCSIRGNVETVAAILVQDGA